MPAPLRLAVFDVDGTLIDSQHNIVAAMCAACRAHGAPEPSAAVVRRVIGLSLVEAVAAVLPLAAAEEHRRVAELYKEAFVALRRRPDHDEPLFPGVLDVFASLEDDGWLLGVATGKSRRGVANMIERHRLEGRFATMQTADDNPGKPHPGMLLRAMAEAGVAPGATVMIGDTAYDMAMARAAKVDAVGVAWGYHEPDELREAGARVVVDDHPELAAAIRQVAGARICESAPL